MYQFKGLGMHQSHNSFKMVDTIVGLCHFHEFAEPALHNGAFHLQTDPNGRSLLPSVFCPPSLRYKVFRSNEELRLDESSLWSPGWGRTKRQKKNSAGEKRRENLTGEKWGESHWLCFLHIHTTTPEFSTKSLFTVYDESDKLRTERGVERREEYRSALT